MIKVLVVDDDRLARRGIIAEMPWDAFDMKVVGEANNGENALEFLRSEEVDLLITDLAMPIMSGLDLMREVQRLYPKIWFVVLTFHQDFELIQEALRIGAIDYIAKTQIEDARMEEVLERISERIRRSQEASLPNAERRSAEPTAAADSMLVYIAGAGQADFGALWQHTSMQGQTIQEVSLGLWTVLPEREMTDEDVAAMKRELVELGLERQVTVLHIRGIRDTDREQLRQRLLRYKEISLFYERKPGVF
ncbi:response regulator, partial [Cohnella sp.]